MTRSSYTISAATLNCIKQLLLSKDEEVDMNPIIQDLGGDDLTAVNVALVLKGVRPNLDTNPRFGEFNNYRKTYIKFEFIKYSLILDKVTAKVTEFTYVPETRTFTSKELNPRTFSLEDWLELSKTPDRFIDFIKLKRERQ